MFARQNADGEDIETMWYAPKVTYYVSDVAREMCTQRAKRKSLRALARSSAKNALVEMLDKLRSEEPPDWFTSEQDRAWRGELDGQRRRIIGPQHGWKTLERGNDRL